MRPVLRWGIVPLLSAMLLSSTPVTADSGDAVPGWLPVGTLTKSGGPNGAGVAMGDDSSVTVVWETTTGSGPLRSVQAVTRVPGEEWSAPVELSGAAGGRRPEIAMSQETVAIWRTSSFPFAVQVSSRGGQAGWSAPITLSSPGVSSDDPRVVINPWSTAVATWVADGVLMAASKPYQGAWSTSEALSDPLHPVLGQTVLASTGQETVAAWIESVDGHDLVRGAIRSATAWGPVHTLSAPGTDANSLDVGAATGNHASVVAWTLTGSQQRVEAVLASGGGWFPRQRLSEGGYPFRPSVVVSTDGQPLVAWQQLDTEGFLRILSSALVGMTWSEPIPVSAPKTNAGVVRLVRAEPPGSAMAVYNDVAGRIHSAVWTAAAGSPGSWTQPQGFDPDLGGSDVDVAADERGNTVAVWVGSQGPETAVRVALGDAVAPSMRFVQLRRMTSRGRELTAKLTVDDNGVSGSAVGALAARGRHDEVRASRPAPLRQAGPVRRSCRRAGRRGQQVARDTDRPRQAGGAERDADPEGHPCQTLR